MCVLGLCLCWGEANYVSKGNNCGSESGTIGTIRKLCPGLMLGVFENLNSTMWHATENSPSLEINFLGSSRQEWDEWAQLWEELPLIKVAD
jgi:hypothetical protein